MEIPQPIRFPAWSVHRAYRKGILMTTGLRRVAVQAPARLHLGFLDLNGSMGRRFGSVGLTLDQLGVSLTAERAPSFSVSGPQAQRADRFA